MPKFAVFLRAINVGGHTVKMDMLRGLFEAQGYTEVETFIASGNVVFAAPGIDTIALEEAISTTLREALGYKVAAFVRTGAELNRIATREAFRPAAVSAAAALNVGFLHAAPDEPAVQKLLALQTGIDEFAFCGREVYWLCRKKQSESTFSNAVLEKTLGVPSTLRGIDTVRKIAAKYFPPGGCSPSAAELSTG